MDREKVIKGLETCRKTDCANCEYGTGVCLIDEIISDALALLKEQQQQIWEFQDQVEYLTDRQKEQKFLVDSDGKITPLPVVVRCKDCEHCYFASNRVPDEQSYACEKHGIDVTPDWYCADGVAKDINVPNKEGR